MKRLILVVLLCVMAVHADEWKLERDRDGVKVYTRRVQGVAFKEYKGVVVLDASLSSLIALFNDLEVGPEWVDSCSRMELVKQVSPVETITYTYSPAPWPVKDRDAVVRSVIAQDPESKVVTITQRAVSDQKPEIRKAVRVKRVDGLWTLTPLENGQVELVYQVLSDPGGGLPAWLVNAVAVSQPFNTLVDMQEMVKREKYRGAVFEYISEP
jgi:hypothetical protein